MDTKLVQASPWEIKKQYARLFQKEFGNNALIQGSNFRDGKINVINLITYQIRALTQVEFNAFYQLPLDYFVYYMVHSIRPYSKTPIQLAYTQLGSPEPVTVATMGALTLPVTEQFNKEAFPEKCITGNAQLTLINKFNVTEDLLIKLSHKLNAWNNNERF